MAKLAIEDLNLKLADLELAACRAVFLGLHRTPGFQLAAFCRLRSARRYEHKISSRWVFEKRKVIAALVERAAIDLGLEREKSTNIERLEAFALVERLATLPPEDLARLVEDLGELPQTGFALVLQAARLGVTP